MVQATYLSPRTQPDIYLVIIPLSPEGTFEFQTCSEALENWVRILTSEGQTWWHLCAILALGLRRRLVSEQPRLLSKTLSQSDK